MRLTKGDVERLVDSPPSDAVKIVSERTTIGNHVAGSWPSSESVEVLDCAVRDAPSVLVDTTIVMDLNPVLNLDWEVPNVLACMHDRDDFIKRLSA